MDTIERSFSLAEAQRIIAQHGGQVLFPETPQERLEGKWQHFLSLARDMECLLGKGVVLPPRPRPTVMPSCAAMVNRVLSKLQETTPVEVPEPEPAYAAEF